jgi:hypothetical protein
MINEEIKHLCPDFGSYPLKRKEFTDAEKQKYKCKTLSGVPELPVELKSPLGACLVLFLAWRRVSPARAGGPTRPIRIR